MAKVQWRSKLGNDFDKEAIEQLDKHHHKLLKQLRSQGANSDCADCTAKNQCTWAVLTHHGGAFVCVRCASIHRGIGTHISKVKGLSGTYLWGPDEIEAMQEMGNERIGHVYGGKKPEATASNEELRKFIIDRYDRKKWFNQSALEQSAGMRVQQRSKPKATTAKASGPKAANSKAVPGSVPEEDLISLFFGDTSLDIMQRQTTSTGVTREQVLDFNWPAVDSATNGKQAPVAEEGDDFAFLRSW